MKIRYVNLRDAPAEWQELLRVWRNSEHVRREMLSQNEVSPEEHSRWLNKILSPDARDKIRIAVSDGGIPFGVIRLKDIDSESGTSDWGLYIGEKKFLGRGFGKKMLRDLVDWAFNEENLNELHTTVHKNNESAKAIYMTVGFIVVGETENFYKIKLLKNIISGAGVSFD